jgi:acetyl-CoA synthetase
MPACSRRSRAFRPTYRAATRADDMAVFQYTSGTTRELPAAVKHSHRTVVTLMFAALYGTGIRPGDEFFCPSSPAWGHGLWHGTLAPLALGVTTGTFAGRFDAVRLMKALQDYKITNMSAAATHYRMMKNSARRGTLLLDQEAVLHRRADRSGDAGFHRPDLSRAGVQHVRHHRDRRRAGQLPGRRPIMWSSRARWEKPVPGLKLEVQKPDGARGARRRR